MSVFLVEDETFVKVFNTLALNQNHLIKGLSEGYGLSDLKGEIERLHEANYRSYYMRYNEIPNYKPLVISERDFSRFDNPHQLLKSMECILYQIELDEKSFDYSFINRAIYLVTRSIIESLPEYDKAIWG
ncbi:hypothetical protein PUS82_00495 [Cytobacillus firmus]|uniref:hypothetical protein n=1 Tax=Cytobacillus firmus TaxID=1399 RepID=UPI00237AF1F0|nr:hypothetical protein [Cytobacillus firmus]MDD9309810.1 hypothetical protein [Cytobacillus firmus]